MYTPYANLDAHSQNRLSAVSGLTTTSTLPTIPSLYPVPIAPGPMPAFARPVSAFYRNGILEIRGLGANEAGVMTVLDARGSRVARVRVAGGRSAEAVRLPQGVYAFRLAVEGANDHVRRDGRFSVFE
jgi:hypothetical protein